MYCIICGKSAEETEIYEGIYDNKISKICGECAQEEEIPLIKKPSEENLIANERVLSVRERMEKLSEPNKPRELNKEQIIAHKNLGKLKIPKKRQESEELIENYDWKIRLARRRKKLTIPQLAQQIGISVQILYNFEQGQIPENLRPLARILEKFLEIKLLRQELKETRFHMPEKNEQRIIIEQTRQNIRQQEGRDFLKTSEEQETEKEIEEEIREVEEEKEELLSQISQGNLDFSKKDKIQNITINDLAELKKRKEKDDLMGRELEID